MNLHKLIKDLKDMRTAGFIDCNIQCLLNKLEEVVDDKVILPKYVEDWLKYCKSSDVSLYDALGLEYPILYNYVNQKDYFKLRDFFDSITNQETFAKAWLNDYGVEKEKRYIVKVKGIDESCNCLNYNTVGEMYSISTPTELDGIYRIKHTRKQLEESGFEWVFSCEGMVVKEVE